MRSKSLFTTVAIGVGAFALVAALQAQAPKKPFEGAGPTPCYEPTEHGGSGAAFPCPAAPHTTAIKAGRLFDSKTGKMMMNQVIVVMGDKIMDVGPAAS